MEIKILAITHKAYWMPKDKVYMPLQVGKAGKASLGYVGDDVGENISEKNANFCELTGMYWAWKNLSCDYIGVCHYRRYFATSRFFSSFLKRIKPVMRRTEYEALLSRYDVILPKKRHYYIETVRSQYEHAHYKKDLAEAEKIISEKYPEYAEAFQQVMSSRSLYIYNMFVMQKNLFDEYCSWLFDIVFELEKRIDIKDYTAYEARVFGFIAERLFNVWLTKKNLNFVEIPVVFLEQQHWVKKIYKFLKRKFK